MGHGTPPSRRRLVPVRRWWRRRGRRARLLVLAVAVALLAGLVGAGSWVTGDGAIPYQVESRPLTVKSGPDRDEPTRLDTSLYVPESATPDAPSPAVLLAHGFGGTKETVADQAAELAEQGYVVLTWTARGFGRSSGQIRLMDPDYEVADAQGLIDWLADRPEVRRDSAGDPRVGAVGGSYGGALALMLAGSDDRVDAIVPQVTWNDLSRALFPESTGAGPLRGVFKRAWASELFGAGLVGPVGDPGCGRFAPEICRMYQEAATTGRADAALVELLRRHSPAAAADRIEAPTLLVQGLADTLFPVSEADATARQLRDAGTPVQVAWFTGGHAGAGSMADEERVQDLTRAWLDHHLWGRGPDPGTAFSFSRVNGTDPETGRVRSVGFESENNPGLRGNKAATSVALAGEPVPIANPAGGAPAAVSSLPGLGEGAPTGVLAREIPGQAAPYESAPLADAVTVTGTPTVRLRAASPTREAVLFVKLYDVAPDGTATLPMGHAAPVRLTGLPDSIDEAEPVPVTLPGIAHQFDAGHRLRVVVATSDDAYAGPRDPRVYTVDAAGALELPAVRTQVVVDESVVWPWIAAGVSVAIALTAVAAWLLARRRTHRAWSDGQAASAEWAETPLVIDELGKTYADGLVAVDDVGFVVRRREVVGLLGPNGAGKTTILRMLLGLVRPSAGQIAVFGHRLTPGAPVLSRVGALVEGPGFLPHLSGRANLELFWRATGRPAADAGMGEVLEIADLGDAIDRKVGTYSHGMRQRLAIAQAMLGLPDLLVLDEPTDGLDPPQIATMRQVLWRYADGGSGGRAVLLSSHLLAEVEQTCTHVVVLHRGRRVAAGPVRDIIGTSSQVTLTVDDAARAEAVLADVDGVQSVARQNGALVVELGETDRAELVRRLVQAGVGVETVTAQRRLEDAFLALVGGDR